MDAGRGARTRHVNAGPGGRARRSAAPPSIAPVHEPAPRRRLLPPRLRAEPGRPAGDHRVRAARHPGDAAPRRGPRRRRPRDGAAAPGTRHRRVRPARRGNRTVGAPVHDPRIPVRRRSPAGPANSAEGSRRRPRLPHRHAARPGPSSAATRWCSGCTTTSAGACAATSSTFPPTAPPATSASAGPATCRSSRRPALFLYDCAALLDSWLTDVGLEQLPDGTVPWYVPVIPSPPLWTPIRPGAGWGDVAALTPVALYQATGDAELLRRHYAAGRAWVDLVDFPGRSRPALGHRIPARRLAGSRRARGRSRRPARRTRT